MTYFPFVYLILLSPEQYYTNSIQPDGYQPMPMDNARKIEAKDHKIYQQPVFYVPYVYLPPFTPFAPDLKGRKAGEDAKLEDENKENDTVSDNGILKVGYNLPLQHCLDGFFADENGNCQKGINKGEKELSLDRKKRATTQQHSNGSLIFKLSKKISVRQERSAEEKKLSYADIVKYGRRGPPRKANDPQVPPQTSSSTTPQTSTSPSTTSPKPLPQLLSLIPSDKSTPASTPKSTVTTSAEKTSSPVPVKSSAGDDSSKLISAEGSSKKPNEQLSPDVPPTQMQNGYSKHTTKPPYLYLVTTICENGYEKDENGNCVKSVKKKNGDKWSAKLERKRRDTDPRLKMLKEMIDAEDGIVDQRNLQRTFYYKNDKKSENDSRKTDTSITARSKLKQKARSEGDTPDKNAASDGFGYISKECSKLVPGLVSDGAGGCTKSVKPKEKILQLERKKRQAPARTSAFINFIDPNNLLRRNNFTIRISLKGFTKQLNFTGEARDEPREPYDDGNKAVADSGFGVSSSKCDGLVPGLVPDGVGGCTRAITTRKRNKFSFVVKNLENSQPTIDVEYDNPEPELVNNTNDETNENPNDNTNDSYSDPDADII